MLALQQKTKISVNDVRNDSWENHHKTNFLIFQVLQACKTIPFAKAMKKPEILQMLSQLAEHSLIATKTFNLIVDELDVKFAMEDTPFYALLDKIKPILL